jgi:hypothetical protein
MARLKAAIPVNVAFATRTTQGERDAINEMVDRWVAKRAEESGLPSAGDGLGTWFRAMVRQMAKDQGIAIVEPEAPAEEKPATKSRGVAHAKGGR